MRATDLREDAGRAEHMNGTFFMRRAARVQGEAADPSGPVAEMLADLEMGRGDSRTRMARDRDRFSGDIMVSEHAIADACARVPPQFKDNVA